MSDIPPTTLRLPPAVSTALKREAAINGRSLSQEITTRLLASLQPPQGHARASAAVATGEAHPAGGPTPPLGETQRMLLSRFNALSPERQLALLTLLGS